MRFCLGFVRWVWLEIHCVFARVHQLQGKVKGAAHRMLSLTPLITLAGIEPRSVCLGVKDPCQSISSFNIRSQAFFTLSLLMKWHLATISIPWSMGDMRAE